MSAGDAGGGGGAEGGLPAGHAQEAELAGTVGRMARCCGESGINYCFWLKIQQV